MKEKGKDFLYNIKNIIKVAFNVLIFLVLPVEIIYLASDESVLTERSFNRINELNNEFEKLSDIEGKVYPGKEELKYDVLKRIDPKYFDNYYFLNYYLFDYRFQRKYYPNIDELEKIGIAEKKLENAANVSFYSLDSINSFLKNLSEDINYRNYNTYIKESNQEHFIKPLSEIIINKDDISLLRQIQNNSYKSTEELEQAIREVLGLDKFKQYWDFIEAVKADRSQWKKNMLIIFIVTFLLIFIARIIIAVLFEEHKKTKDEKDISDNIEKAKAEISEQPDKIKPVWDLANYTLQKYYNKNLSQVNSIYKLSIIVMVMGFLLIVSILIASIFLDKEIEFESIGIIAGIITEFIGATFLFIYKSTIKQALKHSNSLEEINKVGMSIKIIESLEIDENNKAKIDDVKLEIAKELITTHNKRYM